MLNKNIHRDFLNDFYRIEKRQSAETDVIFVNYSVYHITIALVYIPSFVNNNKSAAEGQKYSAQKSIWIFPILSHNSGLARRI